MVSEQKAGIAASRPCTADVRCLVVEDHVLVLQWLCVLLQTLPDVRVVATATSLADAAASLKKEEVDLLVVDASLPDGRGEECVRATRERFSRVQCVVLHDSAGDDDSLEAQSPVSAAAIIHKRESVAAFMQAVQSALSALRGPQHGLLDDWLLAAQNVMSKREYDIFCGIGRGLANKEIPAALGLSPQTVETHRKAVARKLGTSGSDLIRKATIHVMVAASTISN
jgi:DNA-binding NarL/FixJ family response regulator